jgi:hypothetical protein
VCGRPRTEEGGKERCAWVVDMRFGDKKGKDSGGRSGKEGKAYG